MIIQSNLVNGEFQELAANKRQEVQIMEGYYLLTLILKSTVSWPYRNISIQSLIDIAGVDCSKRRIFPSQKRIREENKAGSIRRPLAGGLPSQKPADSDWAPLPHEWRT